MPDLVERDFTADRTGIEFVGDITTPHQTGLRVSGTVIGCYSKNIAGGAVADYR